MNWWSVNSWLDICCSYCRLDITCCDNRLDVMSGDWLLDILNVWWLDICFCNLLLNIMRRLGNCCYWGSWSSEIHCWRLYCEWTSSCYTCCGVCISWSHLVIGSCRLLIIGCSGWLETCSIMPNTGCSSVLSLLPNLRSITYSIRVSVTISRHCIQLIDCVIFISLSSTNSLVSVTINLLSSLDLTCGVDVPLLELGSCNIITGTGETCIDCRWTKLT